jgi:hypothetical protein
MGVVGWVFRKRLHAKESSSFSVCLVADLRFVPLWIGGHEKAMRERLPNKPLVLEEFGKVGSAVPIPGKTYYNVSHIPQDPSSIIQCAAFSLTHAALLKLT